MQLIKRAFIFRNSNNISIFIKKPIINTQKSISVKIQLQNNIQKYEIYKYNIQTKETINQKLNSKIQPIQYYDQNINLQDLKYLEELGKGSYATVKLAQNVKTQCFYAVKIYPRHVTLDREKLSNIKREIQILRQIEHKNVIKLISAQRNEKTSEVIMVMEYIGKMSLYQYLKAKTELKLDEQTCKKIFQQIIQGIDFCHQKNIIHRDIKLENILFDENTQLIKIIDFGFSVQNYSVSQNCFCGTPSYMSPQIIQKKKSSQKDDLWALGILLYQMLQGTLPFKSFSNQALFQKISKGQFSFVHPISLQAQNLIKNLLNINQEIRPTAEQVLLNDEWLKI